MRAALRIVILVSFSLLLPVAARAQANPEALTKQTADAAPAMPSASTSPGITSR